MLSTLLYIVVSEGTRDAVRIYLKDEPVIMQWVRESGLCTILLLKVPLTRPEDYSGHILSRHYS